MRREIAREVWKSRKRIKQGVFTNDDFDRLSAAAQDYLTDPSPPVRKARPTRYDEVYWRGLEWLNNQ